MLKGLTINSLTIKFIDYGRKIMRKTSHLAMGLMLLLTVSLFDTSQYFHHVLKTSSGDLVMPDPFG